MSWHVALSNNSCMLFLNAHCSCTNHSLPNEIHYVAKSLLAVNILYYWACWTSSNTSFLLPSTAQHASGTVILAAGEKWKARSRISSQASGQVCIWAYVRFPWYIKAEILHSWNHDESVPNQEVSRHPDCNLVLNTKYSPTYHTFFGL